MERTNSDGGGGLQVRDWQSQIDTKIPKFRREAWTLRRDFPRLNDAEYFANRLRWSLRLPEVIPGYETSVRINREKEWTLRNSQVLLIVNQSYRTLSLPR